MRRCCRLQSVFSIHSQSGSKKLPNHLFLRSKALQSPSAWAFDVEVGPRAPEQPEPKGEHEGEPILCAFFGSCKWVDWLSDREASSGTDRKNHRKLLPNTASGHTSSSRIPPVHQARRFPRDLARSASSALPDCPSLPKTTFWRWGDDGFTRRGAWGSVGNGVFQRTTKRGATWSDPDFEERQWFK